MKQVGKKLLTWCLAIIVLFTTTACGGEKTVEKPVEEATTRTFTDSAGRTVTLPNKLTKIAPSGYLAQVVLASFVPDRMVCLARMPGDKVVSAIRDFPKDLPEVGQFYGKKPDFNKEELIKAAPEVVIDIGERKKTIREDMDQIQENTGVPTIYIELTPETAAQAYKTLGTLLDEQDRAEKVAAFFEKEMQVINEGLKKIPEEKRIRFLQVGGKNGMSVDPEGSSHVAALKAAGGINAAAPAEKTDKKSKTENLNMEEVVKADPDMIFAKDKSTYEDIMADGRWQALRAVKEDKVIQVPSDPYCFVDMPPGVNQMIGIYWGAHIMYPDVFDYDIDALVKEFKETVLNIH
ncbi:MAG: ABC transporter substrate-binding protein [Eubacteriales bacterium]|nr:ABC transporter substrate-binding protein [Eubacteriales bacterium]